MDILWTYALMLYNSEIQEAQLVVSETYKLHLPVINLVLISTLRLETSIYYLKYQLFTGTVNTQ